MADSILSSLLSKSALAIVQSADSSSNSKATGENLAAKLKVAKVTIQYASRPMRHMKENGSTIVDAKIIDQTQMTIEVFCETLNDIKIVNDILMNRKNTYTVSSKGLVFPIMVATDIGIRQSAEMLTASPVKIGLKQLQKQTGDKEHRVVEQAADSSVLTKGIHTVSVVTSGVPDTFNNAIGTALERMPDIPRP
jgi:hypothetical protein